jgi:hypothetical protein
MTTVHAEDYCTEIGPWFSGAWGTFDPAWLSTSYFPTEIHRFTQALFQTWTPINFADFGPYVCLYPPRYPFSVTDNFLVNARAPQNAKRIQSSVPSPIYVPRSCTFPLVSLT